MTVSPSTALHSPTAEDIHSDVSGGTSALSPSMNAIISTRRYEIAHKKYRSLVQERQELMARLEEIETGVMLKAAVCVLVRRWRMKQQARLQKVGMEVAGKAQGLKPGAVKTARC